MTPKVPASTQIPNVYEIVAWHGFWAEYASTSKSVRPIKMGGGRGQTMVELQVSNIKGQLDKAVLTRSWILLNKWKRLSYDKWRFMVNYNNVSVNPNDNKQVDKTRGMKLASQNDWRTTSHSSRTALVDWRGNAKIESWVLDCNWEFPKQECRKSRSLHPWSIKIDASQ